MTPYPDPLRRSDLPPQRTQRNFFGDAAELIVEDVDNLDLIFHSTQDVSVTSESVSCFSSLMTIFFSLHTERVEEATTLDATGIQLVGGRLLPPNYRAGSRLNATRRLPTAPPILLPYRVHRLGWLSCHHSPPFHSCAGAYDATTGENAGNICYTTVTGGDGSDRPVRSGGAVGSCFPSISPFDGTTGYYATPLFPPLVRRSLWRYNPKRTPGVSSLPQSPEGDGSPS